MRKLANGTGSVYKLSGRRSKPWAARKTVGRNEKGQQVYKFIGFYKTRTEAMNALTAYNKSPYSLEGERLCDMYEDFMEEYRETHAPKTIRNTETSWDHLAPLHNESIATLSRRTLQVFFDKLDVTEPVKIRIKTLLKMIMDYSIRYDVIQPEKIVILDYIDLKSKKQVNSIKREIFTKEEINKLWAIDDDIAHIVLFLIYTGLRAGEFCDLTEDDVENDIIHINKAKTNAGIRDVPLSDKAKQLCPLAQFTDYYDLRNKFKAWCKRHDISHNLHDTRHTCVSLLTEANVDERIIQAIVGHKGKNVTQKVYTHIGIDTMRDALNKI